MGKFHDLMQRDLQIRGYSIETQKAYLGHVRCFVRHFVSFRQGCVRSQTQPGSLAGVGGHAHGTDAGIDGAAAARGGVAT